MLLAKDAERYGSDAGNYCPTSMLPNQGVAPGALTLQGSQRSRHAHRIEMIVFQHETLGVVVSGMKRRSCPHERQP